MGLNTTFKKAAKVVFKVFKDLIEVADYVVVEEDGFDISSETITLIDMIIDTFSERDVQFLSFSNLIQPTDVKGIVRGEQLANVAVSTQHRIDVGSDKYSIIAFSTDPAKALYTMLLRKV